MYIEYLEFKNIKKGTSLRLSCVFNIKIITQTVGQFSMFFVVTS